MPHKALVPGRPLPLQQQIAAGEVLVRAWTPWVQQLWMVGVHAYWVYGHIVMAEGEFTLAALCERAAVLNALGATAAQLFKHPLVQQRWPNELEVRNALEDLLGEVFAVRRVRFHTLRVKAPRGPLPGPKPHRQTLSDAEIARREAKVRARWLNNPPHREPTDIEIADGVGMPYGTYRHYLRRKAGRGK